MYDERGAADGCCAQRRLEQPLYDDAPESGPPYTLVDREGKPTFVGFQSLCATANVFKFPANLTLEDVDASTTTAADGKKHWRETMNALGRADGALVRPDVSVEAGALVAVKDYAVAAASLAEVGWTGVGAGNLPMQEVAYDDWTRIANIKDNNAELACRFVCFQKGIRDLLVVYAPMQPTEGSDAATTAAMVSAIHVDDGCRCGPRPLQARQVAVPTGTPGKCELQSRQINAYACDRLGFSWSEAEASEALDATSGPAADGTVDCVARESTIHRAVSGYNRVSLVWGHAVSDGWASLTRTKL